MKRKSCVESNENQAGVMAGGAREVCAGIEAVGSRQAGRRARQPGFASIMPPFRQITPSGRSSGY